MDGVVGFPPGNGVLLVERGAHTDQSSEDSWSFGVPGGSLPASPKRSLVTMVGILDYNFGYVPCRAGSGISRTR